MASAPADLVAFCEQQHRQLVGFMSLYCGDGFLAEEIAQEALARVCRDWTRVRKLDHPDAWLYRVALNLANSFFRRKAIEMRVRRELEARAEPPSRGWPNVELLDAVRRLPRRPRSVILLRYYFEMSVSEVASVLDLPEGTVKTLTRRGIAMLRAAELEQEAPHAV